jgi:hypothetical protein
MRFVYGIENPIRLHLRLYMDDQGRCVERFPPKPQHQGYRGQLYDGVIGPLLY